MSEQPALGLLASGGGRSLDNLVAETRAGTLDARIARVLTDRAEVGVTAAEFAIAETGTMVEVAENDANRLVSSLPRIHVCLVRTDALIGTLSDAAPLLREVFALHDKNCVVSFISGPSRTGDIEMKLTLGVHGPEFAHAVLVSEGMVADENDA